jgi:hypothetical protein
VSLLTDVIGRPGFAYPGTVTVTRTAAGTTDGYGNYIAGSTSSFTLAPVGVIPGSSQLKVLPPGYSAEDTRTLYTTTRLIKLPFPDRVFIDGEEFAVFSVVGPWIGFDGTHYEVHVAALASPGGY